MNQSKIESQKTFYLKHEKNGFTTKVQKTGKLYGNGCYREVIDLKKHSAEYNGGSLYVDEDFDLVLQFAQDDVEIRRLSTLYPLTNKPDFFDLKSCPSSPADHDKVPGCLSELALFPTAHYRSLFITQDYSPSGKYILIINRNGRFEVTSVDDRIPIYKKTLEPIWGLSFQNPWELILLKTLAKELNGYKKIYDLKPFDFIEKFSNPTWRYYNLTKTPNEFIRKYGKITDHKHAKVILKTNKQTSWQKDGFLKNSASYQIIPNQNQNKQVANIADSKALKSQIKRQKPYVVLGTSKSKWAGQFGYLDKKFSESFKQFKPERQFPFKEHDIPFKRTFFISAKDILCNFSAAYFTSVRDDNYFSGYYLITIAANQKKAQYYEFDMPTDGFFDFCFTQSPENMVAPTKESKIQQQKKRFLKTKFMLIRENQGSQASNSSKPTFQFKFGDNSLDNSEIKSTNANLYRQTRYTLYEADYLKGYNKGDANFLYINKGRYILRFKSEHTDKIAKYYLNWVSSSQIDVKKWQPTKQQKEDLLHQSIVSFMHKAPHYSFDKTNKNLGESVIRTKSEKITKTHMVSYGDTFEDIGYGFFSIKSAINCPYTFWLQFDPKIIQKAGYRLKGRFKDEKQSIKILIRKGDYECVVLKKSKYTDKHQPVHEFFKIWKEEQQGEVINESGIKSVHENSSLNGQDGMKGSITKSLIPKEKQKQEKPNGEILEEEEDEYGEKAQH